MFLSCIIADILAPTTGLLFLKICLLFSYNMYSTKTYSHTYCRSITGVQHITREMQLLLILVMMTAFQYHSGSTIYYVLHNLWVLFSATRAFAIVSSPHSRDHIHNNSTAKLNQNWRHCGWLCLYTHGLKSHTIQKPGVSHLNPITSERNGSQRQSPLECASAYLAFSLALIVALIVTVAELIAQSFDCIHAEAQNI